jgi:hypothetical protein
MIDNILAQLTSQFQQGIFPVETTFYFTVDDIKKTVTLNSSTCLIQEGKTVPEADCVCKTTSEMFAKIWNDGYRPSIMDFMGGKIKTNAPHLLQQFLTAFGK